MHRTCSQTDKKNNYGFISEVIKVVHFLEIDNNFLFKIKAFTPLKAISAGNFSIWHVVKGKQFKLLFSADGRRFYN